MSWNAIKLVMRMCSGEYPANGTGHAVRTGNVHKLHMNYF